METATTKQLGDGNSYKKTIWKWEQLKQNNLVTETATTKQFGNGNSYNKTTW